ncbi:hypothetical protein [Telluribacter sp. SYSU D00476]|uniref:hypothetical protein n=1 Tax=Telluribacter sp. SYSU D00476 TaxID=2811430 RepID=UPI001FF504CD|nr:hypothetical protein [Telluribacter sp. SYSU D00476]
MHTPTPLTDAQIDALYSFVKKKNVDYYDLQLELVDHLASEVEQQMAAEPSVSFEAALQKVYARFGIFGFTEVLEQKHRALVRRDARVWWNQLKALFRLPLLLSSGLAALLLCVAFDYFDATIFLILNGSLAGAAGMAATFYFYKSQPKKGYKLSMIQYYRLLQAAIVFNPYQSFFISYTLLLPTLSGGWLLLIPLLCWLGWLVLAAGVLAYQGLLREQQRLYPLAFI